jgi:hypothetical protein
VAYYIHKIEDCGEDMWISMDIEDVAAVYT